MNSVELSPYTLITGLIAQQLTTWAYKHPNIAWINRDTVKWVSILVGALSGLGTAYASGNLQAVDFQNVLDAAYSALCGAGLNVAFYEWTKKPA